ncbi:MAG TPA: 3-hydroxyacyl-CoA dehydrogenase NAD-binding domain-containing protein [Steroidobacteraceae bacterium]|jgi:3-hydroxyacyl-CoA dehydrogenase/enoyl-CoA hydratase/3-hydroxybutyryl-CoA epimerase|nr:3-hydroxyacyl-CoA dehydrogenase NAD-binding domain-containing protein [Steroidobacteraceae bacterium]
MADANAWKLDVGEDGIAWLTLDQPVGSANTLSGQVLRELEENLRSLRATPGTAVAPGTVAAAGTAAAGTATAPRATTPIRGLVIRSGKASGFIAGADIREFTSFTSSAAALEHIRLGQRLCGEVEALPYPTVAAIHGFALGGGLELALACRYRVAVGDSKLALGLPEVQLGIHPGFGGTVRSVRLLGTRPAMNLMLTGRPVRADRAVQLGLVDRLVASRSELDEAARQLIRAAPAPHRPPLAERMLRWPGVRRWLRPALLKKVRAQARREFYPAPYAIVELWSRYGARGEAAYAAEADSIAALFRHDTTRNLIRVFLLQDRLKGLAGKSATALEHVHVVGAGVMGGDIAAWCALRGLAVTLQDRELRLIEPVITRARGLFEKRLSTPAERVAALQRLQPDIDGAGAADADLVIEAIFEDLEAKRALYAAAEPHLRPAAVLASNTSSLTLESLAATLTDPGRLVGLHFFNPVAQMPLLEVVHFSATRPEVLATALAFARRIDKLPLPCRSSPGFLVNRVLFPYLYEALRAAGEGIAIVAIDRAAVDFGMPMGPMELCDVVGLDVLLHVGQIIARELHQEPPALMQTVRKMVEEHKLGRKSGQGFYSWHDGKAVREPDHRAERAHGAPDGDLADRLILATVNECVACLRERIVEDADLIDAGVIFGTGFAPFRGGPLTYARARGIDSCLQRLQQLAQRYGARFQPDAGWSQLRAADPA